MNNVSPPVTGREYHIISISSGEVTDVTFLLAAFIGWPEKVPLVQQMHFCIIDNNAVMTANHLTVQLCQGARKLQW